VDRCPARSERGSEQDRLFKLIEYLTIYLDMEVYAFSAAHGAPKIQQDGTHFATLIGKQFPVNVRHPVFRPFPLSFTPTVVQHYELEFTQLAYSSPTVVTYSSDKWGAVAEWVWSNALVFFYEQHLPWVHDTYGKTSKDRDKWPPIIRFAWALRNAALHHEGRLNITDPNVPPVTWHHLNYDYKDAGLKVFGNVMNLADMLIFMVEFSDELDRLGCPHP
jgi:hypothetical protein